MSYFHAQKTIQKLAATTSKNETTYFKRERERERERERKIKEKVEEYEKWERKRERVDDSREGMNPTN